MRYPSRRIFNLLGLTTIVISLLLSACDKAPSSSTTPTLARSIFVTSVSETPFPTPTAQSLEQVTISALNGKDGKQRWLYQPEWIPRLHNIAAPVVANGVLFVVSDINALKPDTSHPPSGFLAARREEDDHQLWQTEIGALASQPIVENGIIYITAIRFTPSLSQEKFVYALNAQDGKQIWRTQIPDGFSFTMKLVNGNLYISANETCFDSCNGAYLYVLHASNGKLLWENKIVGGDISLSAPMIMNGIAYVSYKYSAENTPLQIAVQAFSANDGKPLWLYLTGLSPYEGYYEAGYFVATNGMVFTSSATGSNQFRPDTWSYSIVALDGKSGKLLWHTPTDLYPAIFSISQNTIYVQTERTSKTASSYDSFLSAINTNNGQLLWHIQLPSQCAVMVATNDSIYCNAEALTPKGELQGFVFALDPKTGSLLWRTPTTNSQPGSPTPNNVGAPLLVLAQGVLYETEGLNTLSARRASNGSLLWSAKIDHSIAAINVIA